MIGKILIPIIYVIVSLSQLGLMSTTITEQNHQPWIMILPTLPPLIVILLTIKYGKWAKAYWGWKTYLSHQTLLTLILTFVESAQTLKNGYMNPYILLMAQIITLSIPTLLASLKIGGFTAITPRGYEAINETPMANEISIDGVNVWVASPKNTNMSCTDKRIGQLVKSIQDRKPTKPLILVILGINIPPDQQYMSAPTIKQSWVQFTSVQAVKQWIEEGEPKPEITTSNSKDRQKPLNHKDRTKTGPTPKRNTTPKFEPHSSPQNGTE